MKIVFLANNSKGSKIKLKLKKLHNTPMTFLQLKNERMTKTKKKNPVSQTNKAPQTTLKKIMRIQLNH